MLDKITSMDTGDFVKNDAGKRRATGMVQNYTEIDHRCCPESPTFAIDPLTMSTPNHQLQTLLDSVNRLLASHQAMRSELHEVKAKWTAAEEALRRAQATNGATQQPSTPTPPSSALSASDVDALVEEIDSCIALLKP